MSDAREFEKLKKRVLELDRLENALGGGSAFPASPTTGALFYRTDLGWLCYYDGTRWLTVHEWQGNSPPTTYSAGTNAIISPARNNYAVYVTRVALGVFVATTNNGSNYWNIIYRGINQTYTAASNIHSTNTSALTASTWDVNGAAPNVTATPANYNAFDFQIGVGAGAPGNITLSCMLQYRMIVT